MNNFDEILEILLTAGDISVLGVVVWLIWNSEKRILNKVENMINETIPTKNSSSNMLRKISEELKETKIAVKDLDKIIHQIKNLLIRYFSRDDDFN